MTEDRIARARELLAAAYEKHGFPRVGDAVRFGSRALASDIICDAILAALASLPDDVMAERERCAKIAEEYPEWPPDGPEIAAAIRKATA